MIDVGFILTCVFVGCVALLGALTLFVRAENIERNGLVGSLTLATSLIAMALLEHDWSVNFPYGAGTLISICLLAIFGFALGRFLDYILGPREHSADSREATIGADLAE